MQSQITNIRQNGAGFIGDVDFYGVQNTCQWTDTGIYARQDSYWDIVWQYSDEWKEKRCDGWMCTVVQDIQGENIPIYLNNKVIETETYTTTHGLKVVLVDGMIYPIKREGSYTTSINPYKATMFFRGIISEPIMPELVLLKTEPPEEAQVLFKLGDIALVEWFIYSPQDTRITYSCTHIPTGKSISNSLLDWANRKRATPIVNWTVKNQITAIKALDKFLKGRQVTADLLREFRETAKK